MQIHILKGSIGTGSGPALMQRVLGLRFIPGWTTEENLTINIVRYQSNVVVYLAKFMHASGQLQANKCICGRKVASNDRMTVSLLV